MKLQNIDLMDLSIAIEMYEQEEIEGDPEKGMVDALNYLLSRATAPQVPATEALSRKDALEAECYRDLLATSEAMGFQTVIDALQSIRKVGQVPVEADSNDIRANLYRAAISCPHTIDANKVVLQYDEKQPGHNALAQLADRLVAAVQVTATPITSNSTELESSLIASNSRELGSASQVPAEADSKDASRWRHITSLENWREVERCIWHKPALSLGEIKRTLDEQADAAIALEKEKP